jgi:hypothetical protein
VSVFKLAEHTFIKLQNVQDVPAPQVQLTIKPAIGNSGKK